MKKIIFSLTIVILTLTINTLCQDPALKINLNPPEETVKDTIGKKT
jgi:hypothetical protein